MNLGTPFYRLAAAFTTGLALLTGFPAGGQAINFQNVPLDVAIVNLARQAGRNFILDPKLSVPFDADGKVIQRATVTLYVANTTFEQALGQILTEHGLVLIEDPVTTVARITFTNQPLKKVDASFLAGDTNLPVPMVVFDDVPMDVAIKNMARTAQLDILLDPKISDGYRTPGGKLVTPPSVSIRWQNITARQALLALCENYDFNVIKGDKAGVWRIEMKP
jgi:hypothetical protein